MRLRRQSTSRRNRPTRQGLVSRQDLDVIRKLIERRTGKQLNHNKENRFFTGKQKKILQTYFDKNNTLSHSDDQLLAKETGLQVSQVKRWFCHRRAKVRKMLPKDHGKEVHHTATLDPLPSHEQLTAIPVTTTTPPSNFPPNQAVEPTTCHASKPTCFNSARIGNGCTQWNVPQSSTSYDCYQSTLQLCDKLLQNMFGYDWIVKLRLNRHV